MTSWLLIWMMLLNPSPEKERKSKYMYDGYWEGYSTQESDFGLAKKYDFELEILQTDSSIEGNATLTLRDASGVFVTFNLTLQVVDDKLRVKEIDIKEQKISAYAYWCLKTYTLELGMENETPVLTGSWNSENCAGSGAIYLKYVAE